MAPKQAKEKPATCKELQELDDALALRAEKRAKRGRGRPPKLILDENTATIIGRLAMIHCSQEEIASILGVSRESFCLWLKRNHKARALYDAGMDQGTKSLRRAQFASALAGNVVAQIWLGKQMLGQKDKTEIAQDVRVTHTTQQIEELFLKIDAMRDRALPALPGLTIEGEAVRVKPN